MRRPRFSDYRRTFIIGNGGAGKTWLASKLSEPLKINVIHLDDLRWEPGHYGIARNNQSVLDDVVRASKTERWLMEGVYGWLANAVLDRATTLIWIDLPEDECVANVRRRGLQGGGSEQAFEELIKWITDYRLRDNSSSFAAHVRLFDGFSGRKTRLGSRSDMTVYLDSVLG